MANNLWPAGMAMDPNTMNAIKSLDTDDPEEKQLANWLIKSMIANMMEQDQYDRLDRVRNAEDRRRTMMGIYNNVASQIQKQAEDPVSDAFKDKEGNIDPAKVQSAIMQQYANAIKNADSLGLLPQTNRSEEYAEEPERPGRGMITVTESADDVQKRTGYRPKYDKDTRLIQAPNGSQIIAKPNKDGSFSLQGRDVDAEGNHVWKPIPGTISRDELDNITSGAYTYAGEDKELNKEKKTIQAKMPDRQKPMPNTVVKPETKKTRTSNILPGGTAGSAIAETVKDMFYRAPLKAIGDENISAAGNTLADMFYRAPKVALTPSDEQREFRMQQARESDPWGKVASGAEWLSKKVLGGLKPY